PKELDFKAALEAAQAPRGAAPVEAVPSREGFLPVGEVAAPHAGPNAFVKTAPELSNGLDGNGVDLDKTMVELARNSLLYGAAAKAVGKKLALLKYVASDGVG
ncbi:MAG TPA: flagellar biosynthesis protein FlgB, partial [Archangium sp.]